MQEAWCFDSRGVCRLCLSLAAVALIFSVIADARKQNFALIPFRRFCVLFSSELFDGRFCRLIAFSPAISRFGINASPVFAS